MTASQITTLIADSIDLRAANDKKYKVGYVADTKSAGDYSGSTRAALVTIVGSELTTDSKMFLVHRVVVRIGSFDNTVTNNTKHLEIFDASQRVAVQLIADLRNSALRSINQVVMQTMTKEMLGNFTGIWLQFECSTSPLPIECNG
jgi:uncharacterized NAD(P)/FAD-binding protein YdhS